MTIEYFNKEQFEAALPKGFVGMGLIQGEYCYLIPVTWSAGVFIRSSVDYHGNSGALSEDSIRVYPAKIDVVNTLPKPLYMYRLQGTSGIKWITRKAGWQERLQESIAFMIQAVTLAGECQVCGEPRKIFKVKKEGANKGKWFATCDKVCNAKSNQFIWLEKTLIQP